MGAGLETSHWFTDQAFPCAVLKFDNQQPRDVHRHQFYELVLILAGRGRHITDRESYPIEAGDVFLLRDDMAHGYADTDRMVICNILFDPHRLQLPLAFLQDSPGYQALFRVEPRLRTHTRFHNRLHLPAEKLAEAEGMIARLQEALDGRQPGYRFQAFARLMDLIVFLSHCYAPTTESKQRPMLRVGAVLSYIEQHYREPLSVRQLAQIAGMSESTLTRTFRRVVGRSPIAHVVHVRILHASELLQRGNVRVTEAAFECGFDDSNYFSRQFRQVTGLTPREFRSRANHGFGKKRSVSRHTPIGSSLPPPARTPRSR